VKEYVVWRVLDKTVDWFTLVGKRYKPMPRSSDRMYKSRVFPGLWLDAEALIAGNLANVFEAAQEGIASVDHQDCVDRLSEARRVQS
jgi:hypothetical protein